MHSSGIQGGALALACLLAIPAHATVVVSNGATSHMDCAAGLCAPTAKNAVLNAGDLQTMLASSDVKITTGSGAAEIHVTAPVTWTSANRLTLDARRSIAIRAAVVSQGTGGVTIATNDGGSGGALIFVSGGTISFLSNASSLIIGGNAYTLVSDLTSLESAVAGNKFGRFALAKDYDAGPHGRYTTAAVTAEFDGTFEGLGHRIANLSVTGDAAAGMFAVAGTNNADGGPADLRDLVLANAVIRAGERAVAGALAARLVGTIENVSSSGSVVAGARSEVGGLAGFAGGSIVNSSSSAGIVSGKHGVAGGLAGVAQAISLSHATGDITVGDGSVVGGLAGGVGVSLSQSYATGNVTSTRPKTQIMGGLVGNLGQANVSDCYTTGSVEAGGASALGGMFGETFGGLIKTSYSAGAVMFSTAAAGTRFGRPRVGGFTGRYAGGVYTSDYWDVDTSGQQNACNKKCQSIEGLGDAALKSGLPAGFDTAIWAQSPAINNGYPYLLANPPP